MRPPFEEAMNLPVVLRPEASSDAAGRYREPRRTILAELSMPFL